MDHDNWNHFANFRRLLGEVYEQDQSWRDQAACKGQDTNMFYSKNFKVQRTALEFCAECPVTKECHQQAMTLGEQGIWGAEVETRRTWGRRGYDRNPSSKNALKSKIVTV